MLKYLDVLKDIKEEEERKNKYIKTLLKSKMMMNMEKNYLLEHLEESNKRINALNTVIYFRERRTYND